MPKRVEFNGWKLDLELPSNVDSEIDRGDWFDVEVKTWIEQHVSAGMNCIDAGANWGLFTLLMASRVGEDGRVYAFEPASIFFRRLQDHLTLNDPQNVWIWNAALGDRDGEVVCTLEVPPYSASARVDCTRTSVQYDQDELVQCYRLDSYWPHENRRLDFIKIDVDGSEERLLLGAAKTIDKYRPKIAIEFLMDPQGANAAKWLEARGYTFWQYKGGQVNCDWIRGRVEHGMGSVNVLALP